MSEIGWKRSHTCGELRKGNVGQTIILNGWVAKTRDHGGVIFVDLRDRYGVTQVVFGPGTPADVCQQSRRVRNEWVLSVVGQVQARPEGMTNLALPTGEVEVAVRSLTVLNMSDTPPFHIEDRVEVSEETRLKYRYLDLRRQEMQHNLIVRHRLCQLTRTFFDSEGFVEVETPVLMKSTPEGARDFLVPSRINKGRFYALPQSPQTYKQLLMISGFDKYFQIVKCFRDEDLRADRQPEFTQIDVEMSFVEEADVQDVVERLVARILKEIRGVEVPLPFPRLTWAEAMLRYGNDKPDLRLQNEIVDLRHELRECGFSVFESVLAEDGFVGAICMKGGASLSRKELDNLVEKVKQWGGRGMAFAKVGEEGWQGGISKFITPETRQRVNAVSGAGPGDILLFVADKLDTALDVLGQLRLEMGYHDATPDLDDFRPAWIVDFPLLEYSQEEGRYVARHHPFTSPKDEDLEYLHSAPDKIMAKAYDLVINGYEIAGGSIRIHKTDVQKRVFDLLGIAETEAREKFGFLLDALSYGAPPHGGIAFGLDRFAMILANRKSIRDVIAFPKTSSALSLMDESPSTVSQAQLEELGIEIAKSADNAQD